MLFLSLVFSFFSETGSGCFCSYGCVFLVKLLESRQDTIFFIDDCVVHWTEVTAVIPPSARVSTSQSKDKQALQAFDNGPTSWQCGSSRTSAAEQMVGYSHPGLLATVWLLVLLGGTICSSLRIWKPKFVRQLVSAHKVSACGLPISSTALGVSQLFTTDQTSKKQLQELKEEDDNLNSETKIDPRWRIFEDWVVKVLHPRLHPDHLVRHWKDVPEEELMKGQQPHPPSQTPLSDSISYHSLNTSMG